MSMHRISDGYRRACSQPFVIVLTQADYTLIPLTMSCTPNVLSYLPSFLVIATVGNVSPGWGSQMRNSVDGP